MKLKELKERIQEITDEGFSEDTEILVYADHGQTEIKAGYVSVAYCEDDKEYYPDMIHEDDLSEAEDYDIVIVISD